MCVRVHFTVDAAASWNPKQETISIPAHLEPPYALRAVRAILAKLAVVQPEDGAVCWCGEPVRMCGVTAIPSQRPPSEVMSRGA